MTDLDTALGFAPGLLRGDPGLLVHADHRPPAQLLERRAPFDAPTCPECGRSFLPVTINCLTDLRGDDYFPGYRTLVCQRCLWQAGVRGDLSRAARGESD